MRGSRAGGSFPVSSTADCRASPGFDSWARLESLSPSARAQEGEPSPIWHRPGHLKSQQDLKMPWEQGCFSPFCSPLLEFDHQHAAWAERVYCGTVPPQQTGPNIPRKDNMNKSQHEHLAHVWEVVDISLFLGSSQKNKHQNLRGKSLPVSAALFRDVLI